MASTCVTSLDLCALRVAKLTDAGAPIAGANNGYISDAAVSLQVKITTEAGDDLTNKNGCGNICSTFLQPDQIKGVELELVLCQLDAELLEIMTGAQLFMEAGDVVGLQYPAVGATPPAVAVEGWSKAWDSDHQLSHTSTSPDATWIHWVWPLVRFVIGDHTLEHALMNITLSGKGSENPSLTANGAFEDFPAAVVAGGGITRVGGWFLDTEAPPAECTYIPVTSLAS